MKACPNCDNAAVPFESSDDTVCATCEKKEAKEVKKKKE